MLLVACSTAAFECRERLIETRRNALAKIVDLFDERKRRRVRRRLLNLEDCEEKIGALILDKVQRRRDEHASRRDRRNK